MRIYISLLLICFLGGCASSAAERLQLDARRAEIEAAETKYLNCALKKAAQYAVNTKESPSDISAASTKFCEQDLSAAVELFRKSRARAKSTSTTNFAIDLEGSTREACRALVIETRAVRATVK